MERPRERLAWLTLAIAAAVALTLALADGADAKKKKRPYKTGPYVGTTTQGHPIGFMVEKKKVTGLFVDLMPPCFVSDPTIPMPPPSFAGLEGKIEVVKAGAVIPNGGKKKVGAFVADAPDGTSFVQGHIKKKKAAGDVFHAYPGCAYQFLWEAKLSK